MTGVSNDLPPTAGSRILAEACEAAGFQPRFAAVQAQEHYTAIAFVRARVGITVVPGPAAHEVPADAKIRALPITPPQPVRHIAAVVRDPAGNRAANRAVELLLELIG